LGLWYVNLITHCCFLTYSFEQKQSGRKRPQIHWCPTGPFAFLPLHAAYGADTIGVGCSDYCVSSYTPTITALLNAQHNLPTVTTAATALLVAEHLSPGLSPLENVSREVETASTLLLSMNPIVIGTHASAKGGAMIQAVVDNLPQATVFHLACHGEQDPKDPLNSGFGLRDGRLTVAALMKLNLKNSLFAYLSACETAKGDGNQPDQSVHLAAAMLFIGFHSVVATMWYDSFSVVMIWNGSADNGILHRYIHDIDGPIVAKSFYKEVMKSGCFDFDAVPYALDAAVQDLRKKKVPVHRWAPFIHMGA